MSQNTETRLRKLLCDVLGGYEGGCFTADFPWTARLKQDLGADSLDYIELAMAIDQEFGVSLDDDAVFAWRTAGDVFRSVMVVADA